VTVVGTWVVDAVTGAFSTLVTSVLLLQLELWLEEQFEQDYWEKRSRGGDDGGWGETHPS